MPHTLPRVLLLVCVAWVMTYWLLPGPWRPARSPAHLPDFSADRDPPPGVRPGSPGHDAQRPVETETPGTPPDLSPGREIKRSRSPESDPAGPSGTAEGSAAGADAEAERFHIVEPGDSLWKISLRYYGTGDRAGAIFEANRDVLKSPASLKLGTRLRLPAP